ncbi:MAG: proteasome assembly chaperone family protein [Archaeoglobaceae archaeon]|nr:proteasome assembly chaperone family protein [Archaeoglobaceae archaeon]MDW7989464.1 proteasome assembly chaperone family protein [Archaeoglobaceae archaeon]
MEFDAQIIVEKPSVKNSVLVTSFPGIGLVGTIATAYFINEVKLDNLGILESRLLPPVASLYEGVVLPPIRIYESKELNLLLIHSDVPIVPQIAYGISKVIVNWAMEVKARRVFSLAGIATFEDKKRVFGAVTQKELIDEIKDHVEIFRTGTISGIAGSILNECVASKFPGIALLGETSGFNPDPRAAANLIGAINRIFGWKISVEKLIEEAEFIEAQMQKLAQQAVQEVKREEFPMYG